jgi:hypothetical protein
MKKRGSGERYKRRKRGRGRREGEQSNVLVTSIILFFRVEITSK